MSRARGIAAAGLTAAALLVAGCGSSHHTTSRARAHPLDGTEPAVSPALHARPTGRIVAVGALAEGIIAAPAAGVVAVAVRDPDRIALLSTRTGAVVRHVAIQGPARHLVLQGARTLLVPEAPVDRLGEIALPSGRTLRVAHTGSLPHDAVALDGRVFVADEFGHSVTVLSGTRTIDTIRGFVQPGGGSPVAGLAAIVDVAADTVTLIDPHTLREVGRLHVGTGITHDAPGADDRLYVADTRGGALYTLAVRPRLRVISRLALPDKPYGVAEGDGHVWVTQTGLNRLVELTATAHPRVVATFPTVRQPNTVAVDPADGEVYVAGSDAGVVQELHP